MAGFFHYADFNRRYKGRNATISIGKLYENQTYAAARFRVMGCQSPPHSNSCRGALEAMEQVLPILFACGACK